jgi:hypothetical protein
MSDINTAKASTKTRTMTEVDSLLICVRNSRKMGTSRMPTTRQMAMIWAKREILVLEKR